MNELKKNLEMEMKKGNMKETTSWRRTMNENMLEEKQIEIGQLV